MPKLSSPFYFCLRVWLAAAVVSYPISAASLVWHHDAKYASDLAVHSEWSGGALVAVEGELTDAPVVRTFDRQGVELPPVAFRIPDAKAIDTYGFARGLDGTIALCGPAFDSSGRVAYYIAVISASSASAQVIRHEPFTPIRVALARDGTIWAAGLELVNGEETAQGRSAGVIRHFDRAGKQIGSYIPRSGVESSTLILQGYFAASQNRIGWYPGGWNDGPSEYLEISQDGMVTRFPPTPLRDRESITGIALTDDAGTFLTTVNHQTNTWGILSIDKTQPSWVTVKIPAELASSRFAALQGADGNNLVFSDGPGHLVFVTAAR